jgi:hypothetical protein
MLSLEVALDNGLQLSDTTSHTREDPTHLGRIADAMTAAGWDRSTANTLVTALSSATTRSADKGHANSPWRWLARILELPEWQVRRVACLLAGDASCRGLVEHLIETGPNALNDPDVIAGIRATRNRWSPSTQHWLTRAEIASSGTPRRTGDGDQSLSA